MAKTAGNPAYEPEERKPVITFMKSTKMNIGMQLQAPHTCLKSISSVSLTYILHEPLRIRVVDLSFSNERLPVCVLWEMIYYTSGAKFYINFTNANPTTLFEYCFNALCLVRGANGVS